MTQTKFHNICSILSKHLHNAEGTIFEQYLHNIPKIFVQYLHNIRTIFYPVGMSQFMKFVGKTTCEKITYLHINCTIYGNICIRVKGFETDIGIRERDT